MKLELSLTNFLTPDTNQVQRKCSILLKRNPANVRIVSSFLNSYKERFKKLNEIVQSDLRGGTTISLKQHEISDCDIEKLTIYLEELEILNICKFFEEELLKVKSLSVTLDIKLKIQEILTEWHHAFLTNWDENLENVILQKIDQLHKQQCLLSSGTFNFSNFQITDEDQELLKHGKNMIVPLHKSRHLIKQRIIGECLSYAEKFRLYIDNKKTPINPPPSFEEFNPWFDQAIMYASSNEY